MPRSSARGFCHALAACHPWNQLLLSKTAHSFKTTNEFGYDNHCHLLSLFFRSHENPSEWQLSHNEDILEYWGLTKGMSWIEIKKIITEVLEDQAVHKLKWIEKLKKLKEKNVPELTNDFFQQKSTVQSATPKHFKSKAQKIWESLNANERSKHRAAVEKKLLDSRAKQNLIKKKSQETLSGNNRNSAAESGPPKKKQKKQRTLVDMGFKIP
eukprot:g5957.t1